MNISIIKALSKLILKRLNFVSENINTSPTINHTLSNKNQEISFNPSSQGATQKNIISKPVTKTVVG